jgi:hypothetical protein
MMDSIQKGEERTPEAAAGTSCHARMADIDRGERMLIGMGAEPCFLLPEPG